MKKFCQRHRNSRHHHFAKNFAASFFDFKDNGRSLKNRGWTRKIVGFTVATG
jgi:hypothetical protein